MNFDLYNILFTTASTFLGAFSGWFFGRRGQNAEAKSKEIDNEVKLAEYYKTMLDDLSARYENKYAEVVALYDTKEKILKDEISLLNKKISEFKREIVALRKRVKELEDGS